MREKDGKNSSKGRWPEKNKWEQKGENESSNRVTIWLFFVPLRVSMK